MKNHLYESLNTDDLLIYYQPILKNINSKKIFSLEALIRWDHPKHGILHPKHFIELFKENECMEIINSFIIRKSIIEISNINETLNLNLNISSKEILDPIFLKKVINIIKENNIHPENIIFEISENDYIKNRNEIKNIKKEGFGLLVNNVGVKNLNYNYLLDPCIDLIKIDPDLVKYLDLDKKKTLIIETIIFFLS